MAMLYTIGQTESYERYFCEQDPPMKLGRCQHPQWQGDGDYPGGSVYLTLEESRAACPEGYAPYGLATIIENTYLIGHDRHLIETAPLVKLP